MKVAQHTLHASHRAIADEDQTRADVYALLARLFYGAPDEGLLQAMARSQMALEEGESLPMIESWRHLVEASREAVPREVEDEYQTLFIGMGRPEVMLFASFYLAGYLHEKPLASLRDELRQIGLERDASAAEPEDHLAALCDVMRFLIAENIENTAQRQKVFFTTYLKPWVGRFCEEVSRSPKADFYKPAAAFARTFFEMETQAFEMA